MTIGFYIFAFAAAAAVFSGAAICNYYYCSRIESPGPIPPDKGTKHAVRTDSTVEHSTAGAKIPKKVVPDVRNKKSSEPPSDDGESRGLRMDTSTVEHSTTRAKIPKKVVLDVPKKKQSELLIPKKGEALDSRMSLLPVNASNGSAETPSPPEVKDTPKREIPRNDERLKTRATPKTIVLTRPLPPAPPLPTGVCGDGVLERGLSDAQIKELVDSHNMLRKKVADGLERRGEPGPQPKAVDMKNLTWSPKLASVAQRWANKCNYSHDENRHTADLKIGQNIAVDSVYNKKHPSLTTMIVKNWYDEVRDFDKAMVESYQNVTEPVIGHYTQMVWAKTIHLGCGSVKYSSGRGWQSRYLVCNYSPTGNTVGQPVYLTKKYNYL